MGNTFLTKDIKSVLRGYNMNIDKKMIKSNIPKIRFNNFEAFWVENRIADIVKISAGGDVDKVRLKESGKYPVIANALTNKGIVGFYDDYKVKAPAVTVTGRGDVGYAVARHENFTPIVRLLTLQSEDIDVDYLENQINSMRILNESTGVPQLTAPQLGNYKVYHPEIEEQSAIGSLFRTLDDLLSSYKDNLANYQSLKATMLAKMFPKAGQTIPEIRLDGFEGEWRKLKLRDVVHTNPKSELPENFKYIDLESVVGTRIEKIREERKESAPSRAQRLAKKGDVFYQTVRPYQKNNYLFKLDEIDYVFSTGYAQLRPICKRCDSDFLLILLQNNRFLNKVLDRCTGTSYPAINANELIEILIAIPSYEEQQAIGSYFSNLDNLISSNKEKISQLETLKKKLLQDMFI